MRQVEIDIAHVSKKTTYDLYIERDRDGYGVSDQGGDSGNTDGNSVRDRERDPDVLGSLCCVLDKRYRNRRGKIVKQRLHTS